MLWGVSCRSALACLCGDIPVFRRINNSTCGRKLRGALALSTRFRRPRHDFHDVRITNAGKGNSYSRALTTVLRRTKCEIKLCASPRLISFQRHVQVGKRPVPRRCIVHFMRRRHNFFRPLRPSFFRLAATVTFHCFTSRGISMTMVRIKLNKHLSYAGVVHPSMYVVAGVDFSRARFLKSALTGVTKRGTKVVGDNVPIMVNRAAPRAGPMFLRGTRAANTPVCFTRRGSHRSCPKVRCRLGKLCRRGGTQAVLATLPLLGRTNCQLSKRTIHDNFTHIIRLANLVKH